MEINNSDFYGSGRSRSLKFDRIRTYDANIRNNLVRIDNLMNIDDPHEEFTEEGFDELCNRIIEARKNNHEVILSMGAHVIKCRLSRYLIAMI